MKKLLLQLSVMLSIILLASSYSVAQKMISGNILDQDNFPVIGAAIYVKGTTIGTITDVDGNYSLSIPDDAKSIEVKYLGYTSQNISVIDGNYQNIILMEDINQLDEVVITGLASSVKRSNLANAVASIDARELTGVTSQPTM